MITYMSMTDHVPMWRLQDRLSRALDEADVSVQQMADELGVTRQTVSNYLHGRTPPSRSVLRVWALRTGVAFAWLSDGIEVTDAATACGVIIPGQLSFAVAA